MKDFRSLFRWVAVLPGALLAGLLSIFPIHWILYSNLVRGDFISGVNIDPIEYLISPSVVAFVFIVTGYEIAPSHKYEISLVLFGTYILFLFAVNVLQLIYGEWQFSWSTILALIGAVVGLYFAKVTHNDDSVIQRSMKDNLVTGK